MTDTTAPLKPKYQLLMGLLPSFNSAIVAIVTAALSIGGTLATQKVTAKPVEATAPVVIERVVEKPADLSHLDAKLDAILKALEAQQGKRRKKAVK